MTNPRFGFDNLLDRFKDGLIGENIDPDFPLENISDWRPGLFYKPKTTLNEFSNGDFLLWNNGPSAAPDGTTLTGAGATITQVTTPGVVIPPYAAEVARVGADVDFDVQVDNTDDAMTGITKGVGLHVTSSSATVAVYIEDSAGRVTSAHSGGGGTEYLTVSKEIAPGGTVKYGVEITVGDTTIQVDGLWFGSLFSSSTVPTTPDAPAPFAVDLHIVEGQLLRNWLMDTWSNGGLSLPDLYESISGTLTSVTRDSGNPKLGRYGMTVVGTDHVTGQKITGDRLAQAAGKTVWLGAWADTATISGAELSVVYELRDGTLTSPIAGTPGGGGRVHSGSGIYEWLATSVDVPLNVAGIYIALVQATGGSVTVTWDAVSMVVDTVEPASAPHPLDVDYLALASHNLATAGFEFELQGSTDNFATNTPVFSVTPVDDTSLWTDIEPPGPAANFGSWRLLFTPVAGDQNQLLEIGVLSFGEFFQMPCAPQQPFRIQNEGFFSETPKTRSGAPLGRSIPQLTKRFDMNFQIFLDRDWVIDELKGKWWAHAGGTKGLPFFLQWNDGDYPEETYLVWLPDNSQFDPSLFSGRQVRNFRIQLEGLAR